MNILFLDQFTSIGGGQRSLLEALSGLRDHGWSGRIALPGEGVYSDALRAGGFPVDHIPCPAYSPARKRPADFARFMGEFPWLIRSVYRLAAAHRTGLLYVNGPRLLPAAAVVAKARSIPLVFHSHHRIMQPAAVRLAGRSAPLVGRPDAPCCRFAAEPLQGYCPAGGVASSTTESPVSPGPAATAVRGESGVSASSDGSSLKRVKWNSRPPSESSPRSFPTAVLSSPALRCFPARSIWRR